MKKILVTIMTIVAFSIIAALVMYYFIGWTVQKSVIIAGSSAAAMIVFDIAIPAIRKIKGRAF